MVDLFKIRWQADVLLLLLTWVIFNLQSAWTTFDTYCLYSLFWLCVVFLYSKNTTTAASSTESRRFNFFFHCIQFFFFFCWKDAFNFSEPVHWNFCIVIHSKFISCQIKLGTYTLILIFTFNAYKTLSNSANCYTFLKAKWELNFKCGWQNIRKEKRFGKKPHSSLLISKKIEVKAARKNGIVTVCTIKWSMCKNIMG